MCLDFRPSSKKPLLKSLRALLRKDGEKDKQGTSAFGRDTSNTVHSKNAQKDIK